MIAPRDDGRSLLHDRMKTCDKLKMPPLGRSLRDVAATKTVREWISSLPVKEVKRRLARSLAILAGCFAVALLVGGGTRRWMRLQRDNELWILGAVAAGAIVLLIAVFSRRTLRAEPRPLACVIPLPDGHGSEPQTRIERLAS